MTCFFNEKQKTAPQKVMLHFEQLLSNAAYCTGYECSQLYICRTSTAVYFPKKKNGFSRQSIVTSVHDLV